MFPVDFPVSQPIDNKHTCMESSFTMFCPHKLQPGCDFYRRLDPLWKIWESLAWRCGTWDDPSLGQFSGSFHLGGYKSWTIANAVCVAWLQNLNVSYFFVRSTRSNVYLDVSRARKCTESFGNRWTKPKGIRRGLLKHFDQRALLLTGLSLMGGWSTCLVFFTAWFTMIARAVDVLLSMSFDGPDIHAGPWEILHMFHGPSKKMVQRLWDAKPLNIHGDVELGWASPYYQVRLEEQPSTSKKCATVL